MALFDGVGQGRGSHSTKQKIRNHNRTVSLNKNRRFDAQWNAPKVYWAHGGSWRNLVNSYDAMPQEFSRYEIETVD